MLSCKLLWLWLVHGDEVRRSASHTVTIWPTYHDPVKVWTTQYQLDFVGNKRAKIWNQSQTRRQNSCYANRVWKKDSWHQPKWVHYYYLKMRVMKSMIAWIHSEFPLQAIFYYSVNDLQFCFRRLHKNNKTT